MTSTARGYTREEVEAGEVRLQLRRGGTGESLLVLHSELDAAGWPQAYDELARRFTVYVPRLPGFGRSSRPDWIMSVRDLAAWTVWFIREQRLPTPISVMGFSLGGWLAAEVATMNPSLFKKMVLVAPMGLKPEQGEIFDYFLHSGKDAFLRAFYDPAQAPEFAQWYGKDWTREEADQVEVNREMASRLGWRPYMHSLTLAHLLRGVATPTLLVWGRQDAIVPINCCELYQRAIPGAIANIIDECGHMPEMEKPAEFVKAVLDFLTTQGKG
jgi:pimeloyl-ACP methyl ester carboxylesterase